MILKFKSKAGLVVGATVSQRGYPYLGWVGQCGTIVTTVQKTPGYAAGQLRKKMKREGWTEVKP